MSGGKKVSGRKKGEGRTKSRLKEERRDTCLLRKRREEIDIDFVPNKPWIIRTQLIVHMIKTLFK